MPRTPEQEELYSRANELEAQAEALRAQARKLNPPEIHYSRDMKVYYISYSDFNSKGWLGVEKVPGAVPEEKKNGSIFDPNYAEFEVYVDDYKPDPEKVPFGTSPEEKVKERYHREYYSFTIWDIKRGVSSNIDFKDPLFRDYVSVLGWNVNPEIFK